jgi:hypothetical protein
MATRACAAVPPWRHNLVSTSISISYYVALGESVRGASIRTRRKPLWLPSLSRPTSHEAIRLSTVLEQQRDAGTVPRLLRYRKSSVIGAVVDHEH